MIPKTFIQTWFSSSMILQSYVVSDHPYWNDIMMPVYIQDMIKSRLNPDWQYRVFKFDEAIEYLRSNPDPEFPDIIDRFIHSLTMAHRSDIFRYYYLYQNGGVYIDSDGMLETNIDNIVNDYEFFSALSIKPNSMLNGFIGCESKHPIIYQALVHAYGTNKSDLELDYNLFCSKLYEIIFDNLQKFNKIKIYKESRVNPVECQIEENGILLFKHYHETKIIPKLANFEI